MFHQRGFDNVIVEHGDGKEVKSKPMKKEDIVQPFRGGSIYSLGNIYAYNQMVASIAQYPQLFSILFIGLSQTISVHAASTALSQSHDNPAFEHTSFDPQEGGMFFQGNQYINEPK